MTHNLKNVSQIGISLILNWIYKQKADFVSQYGGDMPPGHGPRGHFPEGRFHMAVSAKDVSQVAVKFIDVNDF